MGFTVRWWEEWRNKEEGKFQNTLSHVNRTACFHFWSTSRKKHQSNSFSCTCQIPVSAFGLECGKDCIQRVPFLRLAGAQRQSSLSLFWLSNDHPKQSPDPSIWRDWICCTDGWGCACLVTSVCQDIRKSSALSWILALGAFGDLTPLLWCEAQCDLRVW